MTVDRLCDILNDLRGENYDAEVRIKCGDYSYPPKSVELSSIFTEEEHKKVLNINYEL